MTPYPDKSKAGSLRQTVHVHISGESVEAEVLDVADTLAIRGPELDLASTCKVEIFENSEDFSVVQTEGDRVVLEPANEAAAVALWRLRRVTQIARDQHATNTGVDSIPARGQYTEAARQKRLTFMREETGKPLLSIDQTTLVARKLTSNIENLVGSVEVPVGIAGPLFFEGEEATGTIFAPLATTEGTLVASASRGARAITRSGGVTTRVVSQRMNRVPIFAFEDVDSARLFARWLRDHEAKLAEVVGEVSRRARLLEARPHVVGRHVHANFLYETGDAAGQNMTTSCTWHACLWTLRAIKKIPEMKLANFIIDGNVSSDKKVSFRSFFGNRGTRVVAEAFLSDEVIEDVLKVSPEQLYFGFLTTMSGAIQSGMVGFNINIANVIAAIFVATGQDVGCVHESSLGHLQLEKVEGGILASMTLTSLIVGTVGGGTALPQQRDYLEMLGCAGGGKVHRLAEIIAGFALALDLSTLAALASNQFAQAHEKLGRNRPVDYIQREDIGQDFVQDALRAREDDPSLTVDALEFRDDLELGSSIITELTAQKVRKLIGHFPMRVQYTAGGQVLQKSLIAKVKPLDEEVILMTNALAAMCGHRLASTFAKHKAALEFSRCDTREIHVYRQKDPRFLRHVPEVFAAYEDPEREAYILLLEHLEDVVLVDTANDLRGWSQAHIEAAIDGMAALHSIWYDRNQELQSLPWIANYPTATGMEALQELYFALSEHAAREFPNFYTDEDKGEIDSLIAQIPSWRAELDDHAVTLIHNDFNPRNICFRQTDGAARLCAYDWELATISVPQRDLAEFLAFVLSPDVEKSTVDELVERHRAALERQTGQAIDEIRWRRGYRLALWDFTVHRMGLYLMAHTFRHYGFLERTFATLRRLRQLG